MTFVDVPTFTDNIVFIAVFVPISNIRGVVNDSYIWDFVEILVKILSFEKNRTWAGGWVWRDFGVSRQQNMFVSF